MQECMLRYGNGSSNGNVFVMWYALRTSKHYQRWVISTWLALVSNFFQLGWCWFLDGTGVHCSFGSWTAFLSCDLVLGRATGSCHRHGECACIDVWNCTSNPVGHCWETLFQQCYKILWSNHMLLLPAAALTSVRFARFFAARWPFLWGDLLLLGLFNVT